MSVAEQTGAKTLEADCLGSGLSSTLWEILGFLARSSLIPMGLM